MRTLFQTSRSERPAAGQGGAPLWSGLGTAFLILAAGILLRVWNTSLESAWLDEVLSLHALDAPNLSAYFTRLAERDAAPGIVPIYFAAQYFWAQLFGPGVIAQRVLALIFSLASLPLCYAVGRRVGGRGVGLVALGVLALSLPHVYYAVEIRRYAWEIFFALLSYYALLRWTEATGRDATGWLMLQLCCHVLLFWSSMFTAVIPLAQGLALIAHPAVSWRRLLSWGAAQGVLIILLCVWLLCFETEALHWMMPPTWRDIVNTLVVFAGGRISNESPGAYYPLGVSLDLPLAVLVYGAAAFGTWRIMRDRAAGPSRYSGLLLLWGWLLVPISAATVLSYVWKPLFLFRYFLFGTIGLYILAGLGVMCMPRKIGTAFLVTLLLTMGYQATVRFETVFRPDYQGAADTIAAEHGSVPILILKPELNGLPFRYLDRFSEGRLHDALGMGDLHEKAVLLTKSSFGCWILLWRWDRMEALEHHLFEAGYQTRRIRLGGIPPLYLMRVERP